MKNSIGYIRKHREYSIAYDKDGKINRGEYMSINFDLGYDPEDFDPGDLTREG